MQLKKFANFLGFTQTELKVLLFLAAVFICGLLIKFFSIDKPEYKNFDYSQEDSIFWASDSINADQSGLSSDIGKGNSFIKDKINSGKNKFPEIKKKELPAELSIDINSASKEE